MKKFKGNIVVYDFLETYHEKGEYTFKIVLGKKMHGRDVNIKMFDPDRNEMELDVRRWGRKMNCSFVISERTSDGVCIVKIDSGSDVKETMHCWIIK